MMKVHSLKTGVEICIERADGRRSEIYTEPDSIQAIIDQLVKAKSVLVENKLKSQDDSFYEIWES
jgi:hypothetical protein